MSTGRLMPEENDLPSAVVDSDDPSPKLEEERGDWEIRVGIGDGVTEGKRGCIYTALGSGIVG